MGPKSRSSSDTSPPAGRGLRARLLALVSLALIPALGLALYAAWEQREQTLRHTREEARRLARLVAADHERLVLQTRLTLIALAQHPDVRRTDGSGCGPAAEHLRRTHPQYADLGVLRRDGSIACSTRPGERLAAADERSVQRALRLGALTVGGLQRGPGADEVSLAFMHPLGDGAGLAYALVGLGHLTRFLTLAGLPRSTAVALVEDGGRLLYVLPEPPRWSPDGRDESALGRLLASRRQEGVLEAPGLDGVSRLFGFSVATPAGGPPMRLAVGIPLAPAFAAAEAPLWRAGVAAIVVLALCLGLAWLAADALILGRLRLLLTSARRYGAGDLGARIRLTQPADEIGELAATLNQMAERLEAREGQHHEALQEVKSGQRFLGALLEDLTLPLCVTAPEGQVWLVNRGWETLTGIGRDDARGQSLDALLPAPTALALAEARRQAVAGRVPVVAETPLGSAGDGRLLTLVVFPVFDRAAEVEALGTVAVDGVASVGAPAAGGTEPPAGVARALPLPRDEATLPA
jgi:PAS domain S-box-containing protein